MKRGASRSRLKALRRKYRLGEFSKKAKRRKGTVKGSRKKAKQSTRTRVSQAKFGI